MAASPRPGAFNVFGYGEDPDRRTGLAGVGSVGTSPGDATPAYETVQIMSPARLAEPEPDREPTPFFKELPPEDVRFLDDEAPSKIMSGDHSGFSDFRSAGAESSPEGAGFE